MSSNSEAPASTSVSIKSPSGFEYIVTTRDFEDAELTKKQLAHLLRMDKALVEMKFTPVVKGFPKKEAKPIEYVADRKCPTCGAQLVFANKRDGTRFIKCSTNKYMNGQSTGCPFVDWMNKPKADDPIDGRDDDIVYGG